MTDEIEEQSQNEPAKKRTWQNHAWSTQEVRFAAEYLRTRNAALSWRMAFREGQELTPIEKVHSSMKGMNLLDKPFMRDYIAEIRETLKERMKLSASNVLEELAKLGYANMSDFVVLNGDGHPAFDLSGLTHEQMAAVQEMTIDTYVIAAGSDKDREVRSVKLKLAPKTPALEQLGRHFKLFTDVVQNESLTDVAEEMRLARAERAARRKASSEAIAHVMGKPEGSDDDDGNQDDDE